MSFARPVPVAARDVVLKLRIRDLDVVTEPVRMRKRDELWKCGGESGRRLMSSFKLSESALKFYGARCDLNLQE